MRRYIDGYKDEKYIFKVCKDEMSHELFMHSGINHLFKNGDELRLYTYDGFIDMPSAAEELIGLYDEDDVLEIGPSGIIDELFCCESDSNAIVVTLKCNSNCVMCPLSEAARKNSRIMKWQEMRELLRYIPQNARHLTITGGEPTLAGKDFLMMMKALQYGFNQTQIQLLTNGRIFSDFNYTKAFIDCIPEIVEVGIPLYGYNESTHDSITREDGSFRQTVVGIHNLLHFNVDVEIRIVLTKQNIHYMEKIADYILRRFPGVGVVTFMGMELMGNAAKNKEEVWVDYKEAFAESKRALHMLAMNGIDVKLYNFPLCTVEKEYWGICMKSISDYKVKYGPECEKCSVQDLCGGVFASTHSVIEFRGDPVESEL